MSQPVQVMTLAQLGQSASWTLELMHPQRGGLLIWTTRGQGVVNLHGHRRGFSTYHAIYVPNGQLWSIELGRGALGLAVSIQDAEAANFPDRCQQLRIMEPQAQSEQTALIDDMRREIEKDRPLQGEVLQAHAQLLSIWLRREMREQYEPKRPKAAERLVEKFHDLAAERFSEGHSMADFAQMLDVTPTHLARVCRQTSGITAADVLSQCVLYKARMELENSDLSIKAIAESLGFGSAAYFTRFIQQHCGTTPSNLRNNFRHLQAA